jgi:hypothetical protein
MKIKRSKCADKRKADYEEKRSQMEPCMMQRYHNVAGCIEKPKFQLVFLIAMLTMSTKTYEQSSMHELLVRLIQGSSFIPARGSRD